MSKLGDFVYTTLHPELYHGRHRRPPFFEGWYFKLVSKDEGARFAIIPGVILGEDGHAFIQVIDGLAGETAYYRFPLNEFSADERQLELRIGPNRFDLHGMHLELASDAGQVRGEVSFVGLTPWPVTLASPGIMGWYAWVPGMECYHGVASLDHWLQGQLVINGQSIDFTGGRGYIEKDWGQSFPSAWVWFQSNHFALTGTCLTASIADIPWRGASFKGFIIGLWLDGRLYRFATYTGAKVERLQVDDAQVSWTVRDRRFRLEMTARRAEGGLLRGPTKVDMGKRVAETMQATVQARLTTLAGEELFAGEGRNAGLEVFGKL